MGLMDKGVSIIAGVILLVITTALVAQLATVNVGANYLTIVIAGFAGVSFALAIIINTLKGK